MPIWLLSAFSWAKKLPYWVWIALCAVLVGRIALSADRKAHEDKALKEFEEDQQAIEKAAVEHTHKIEKEASNEADKALEARDSVGPDNNYDSMSDEEFRLTFGYDKTPEQYS